MRRAGADGSVGTVPVAPMQIVGLGCLQAWTFITYMSGLIHYDVSRASGVFSHLNHAYMFWCVGAVAVSVLGAVPWEAVRARMRFAVAALKSPSGVAAVPDPTLTPRRRLMRAVDVLASFLLVVFTCVLVLAEQRPPGRPWCWIAAFGSGMATGALFWSWATVYVGSMGRYIGARYGAAFGVAALVYIFVLSLPLAVGTALTAALPLASLVCLRVCPPTRAAMESRRTMPAHSRSVFARAIVAVGLVGLAESCARTAFQSSFTSVDPLVRGWVVAGSIAAAAVLIAITARTRPGRDTVGRVNHVLMLAMAFLFLLTPALWGVGVAADVSTTMCYGLFYLFAWTALTQITSSYRLNVRVSFCYGLGAASLGCLVGTLVGSILITYVGLGYRLQIVLALACAALVFASFLFVADDRTFVELFDADDENPSTPRRFQLRCERIAQLYGLTPKETEVMTLIGKGRSAQRIQEALDVSASTVNTHVNHIYRKMGVHSRQEMLDLLEREEG